MKEFDEEDINREDILYKEWGSGRKRKAVYRKCKNCGGSFKATLHQLKKGYGKFCSRSCQSKYHAKQRLMEDAIEGKRKAENFSWSNSLAYWVGLIASDGTLGRSKARVNFTSKDHELIKQFRSIVDDYIDGKPHKPQKITKGDSTYWITGFNDLAMYIFLRDIGITPNKSKNIKRVDIPDSYFHDFFRGEIDGDGSFFQPDDTFVTSTFSGSRDFLSFQKQKVNDLITEKDGGSIRRDKSTYILTFSLFDSFNIYHAIYDQADYYLKRKKEIADDFFSDYPDTLKRFKQQRKSQSGWYDPTNRKLSVPNAIKIIKRYHEEDLTYKDLAGLFDVSFKTIGNIINFNHWTSKELVS